MCVTVWQGNLPQNKQTVDEVLLRTRTLTEPGNTRSSVDVYRFLKCPRLRNDLLSAQLMMQDTEQKHIQHERQACQIIENVHIDATKSLSKGRDGIKDGEPSTVSLQKANTCARQMPNITGDNLNSRRLPHGADENTRIPQRANTLSRARRLPLDQQT